MMTGKNLAIQQWDIQKPRYKLGEKSPDILSDEVEELDALVQNARTKPEIPVEPTMPCVTRIRISTTSMQMELSQKMGGRRVETGRDERRKTEAKRLRVMDAAGSHLEPKAPRLKSGPQARLVLTLTGGAHWWTKAP